MPIVYLYRIMKRTISKRAVEPVVGVVGHFGERDRPTCGQTMLTHVVFGELSKHLGDSRVLRVNTGQLRSRPVQTVLGLQRVLREASHIIMMPGRRGLDILLPVYHRWKRKPGNKLHYLVVGGWLPRHLRQKPESVQRLRLCDGIYVESMRMLEELVDLGLERVHLRPNMRHFDVERRVSRAATSPLRLVFMSRLIREKGVELAVEAVQRINRQAGSTVVELDLWGPVSNRDERWLQQVLESTGPEVKYCGFLQPEQIYSVLPDYDALVFPTFYSGEGFPGVIVDAFVAGIPVLASDWQDNAEFIEDGHNGLIFKSQDVTDLCDKILHVASNPDLLRNMKRHAAESAEAFHVDSVIPSLLRKMELVPAHRN